VVCWLLLSYQNVLSYGHHVVTDGECWGTLPREAVAALSFSVQGQVRWGFEQPGLVEGVPAHGRGVGAR